MRDCVMRNCVMPSRYLLDLSSGRAAPVLPLRAAPPPYPYVPPPPLLMHTATQRVARADSMLPRPIESGICRSMFMGGMSDNRYESSWRQRGRDREHLVSVGTRWVAPGIKGDEMGSSWCQRGRYGELLVSEGTICGAPGGRRDHMGSSRCQRLRYGS